MSIKNIQAYPVYWNTIRYQSQKIVYGNGISSLFQVNTSHSGVIIPVTLTCIYLYFTFSREKQERQVTKEEQDLRALEVKTECQVL